MLVYSSPDDGYISWNMQWDLFKYFLKKFKILRNISNSVHIRQHISDMEKDAAIQYSKHSNH
jgi:hypothetical protein